MIKYMRKFLFIIVIVAAVLVNCSYVYAADISLDAISVADSQGKKVRKLYPGDEFYIVFKVTGDNTKDVKALYGSIEYDESILEIIKDEENPIVEKGWKATGINTTDKKIFFHTQIEDAPETIGYVKMKVKSNIDASGKSVFSVKDANLYKESGVNSFGELTHNKYNADVTLKIGNKNEDLRNIIVIVASVIVLIVIVVFIMKDKKKKTENPSTSIKEIVLDDDDILNSEESLVMQSKDSRAEIQAKMRAVLDEVKKNRAEKDEEKSDKEKSDEEKNDEEKSEEIKKEEVNEASNTDDE